MLLAEQTDILAIIKANHEKFLNFNSVKQNNLYGLIKNDEVINALKIIPLLLHVNQPGLPGYIESKDTPFGISGYTPTPKAYNYLYSLFPHIKLEEHNHPKSIQSLAMMGSGGTIAYTEQSDFDYWVCYYDDHINFEGLYLLKIKCKSIESWLYDTFNIEVHFYINSINKLQLNIFANDEENLSGSSMGKLLKEEFFRSSIIIAGKIPFWWVVPVAHDDTIYYNWLEICSKADYMNDFINIGPLGQINHEDFLSAALFQILKSLGSPFKSIIKLGLLERYLHSSDKNPFISNIIKHNIHQDILSTEMIDAYTIMFNQVFEYYNSIDAEYSDIDVLKKSLYLKVEPQLSKLNPEDKDNEKTRIMKEMVYKWNWNDLIIKDLDNYISWGIDPSNRLLNNAKKFILKGYKKIINNLETNQINHTFTQDEIKGISRKIYSHFLISNDKVDNTLSFKNYPPERTMHIEFIRESSSHEFWILSKKVIKNESLQKVIIYKCNSLFSMIVWISLNGLYLDDYTRLEIDQGLHTIDASFIRELISTLTARFSYKRANLANHYFLKNPFPLNSYIIINPFSKYETSIKNIYFLYHNSWGETKFEIYNKTVDLMHILSTIINGYLENDFAYEESIPIVASLPFARESAFTVLKTKMNNILRFFMMHKDTTGKKIYITTFNNNFYLLQTKNTDKRTIVEAKCFDSISKLLFTISFNSGNKFNIMVDPNIPSLKHLHAIVSNFKKHVIQIYFYNKGTFTHFFISDERGSLFFFVKKSKILFEYLTGLYEFSKYIISQIIENNLSSPLNSNHNIEIYQIKNNNNSFTINPVDPEQSTRIQTIVQTYNPFSVTVALDQYKNLNYKLKFPDNSVTDYIDKNSITDLITAIKDYMLKDSTFFYYITHMNISQLKNHICTRYTSYAFSEKNRLEIIFERYIQ